MVCDVGLRLVSGYVRAEPMTNSPQHFKNRVGFKAIEILGYDFQKIIDVALVKREASFHERFADRQAGAKG
jgi:hypothetical protein